MELDFSEVYNSLRKQMTKNNKLEQQYENARKYLEDYAYIHCLKYYKIVDDDSKYKNGLILIIYYDNTYTNMWDQIYVNVMDF